MPVVCRLRNRCHRAQLERRRNGERRREKKREPHAVLQPAPSLQSPFTKQSSHYTYSNLPITWCIVAHLICGNGGSSDEGRDGGLCNHAVGGDAVRRGVEPERGQREIGGVVECRESRKRRGQNKFVKFILSIKNIIQILKYITFKVHYVKILEGSILPE